MQVGVAEVAEDEIPVTEDMKLVKTRHAEESDDPLYLTPKAITLPPRPWLSYYDFKRIQEFRNNKIFNYTPN